MPIYSRYVRGQTNGRNFLRVSKPVAPFALYPRESRVPDSWMKTALLSHLPVAPG